MSGRPTLAELKKILHINRYVDISAYTFNIVRDYRELELAFPGCSVAWDKNCRLQEYPNHYIRIYNTPKYETVSIIAYFLNNNGSIIYKNYNERWYAIRAQYAIESNTWTIIR